MSYQVRTTPIEAIQVTWANWGAIAELLADQLHSENPEDPPNARSFMIAENDVSDTCGEPGPMYIGFILSPPMGKDIYFRHGDWVVESSPDVYLPCAPTLFPILFEEVEE